MKWIEIIELRHASNTREQLETHLQKLIERVENENEKQTVKFYTHIMLDTDFSIHLFHDSSKVKKQGSSLGVRLA